MTSEHYIEEPNLSVAWVRALRAASAPSYYKGNGSLWIKVVSTGDVLGSGPGRGPGPGISLMVSR